MTRLAPILVCTAVAMAADFRGRVFDSSTNEALSRVKITLVEPGVESQSGPDGRFTLDVAEGSYTLRAAGVGYRPFQAKVSVPGPDLEIALAPDTLRRSESVSVTAGPFPEETATSVGMTGNELKNLASVLADDPLRAVQGLPGVTSNDDFQSQISMRGAGFQRVGVYLDGVLLHSPYHTVQGDANSASLTIFNGDMLDAVNLHAGAPPVRFSDRTAGALDVRTREGDRRRFSVRGTVSASNAGAMLEGPLRGGKGSWLFAARKSYLQYIIDRTSSDPSIGFAFADAQGRAQYDLGRAWNVTVSLMHGTSGLDRAGAERLVGNNALFKTDYDFTLASASLRYAPGRALLAVNRVSFLRERFLNLNRESRSLGSGGYGEWIWNGDATWQQNEAAALQVGGVARRMRDDGNTLRLGTAPTFAILDQFRGTGVRSGFYAQQSWNPLRGRLRLVAGGRADRHSVSAISPVTPYASLGVQPASGTSVTLGWGQYVQFPELSQFFSIHGSRRLLPERATHVELSIEQKLGERTRLRAQVYDRQDRDLLFRPLFDPRILNGRIFGGSVAAPIVNSQRGYARGWQAFLQRRTANGFTGWIGYSWGTARVRDGALRISYPADFDQKHTVNVFGAYRLRPSVNLSVKWLYGSGFPLRGFYTQVQNQFFLIADRNVARIPSYQRTDFRVNKAFIRKRWQLTLFAEVINLTNRDNLRFDSVNSIDGRTGQVRIAFDKMFPILPSAGIVVEF